VPLHYSLSALGDFAAELPEYFPKCFAVMRGSNDRARRRQLRDVGRWAGGITGARKEYIAAMRLLLSWWTVAIVGNGLRVAARPCKVRAAGVAGFSRR
jgi:hypothetical protein